MLLSKIHLLTPAFSFFLISFAVRGQTTQDIYKAFTTLWFWRLEILEKFQIVCQEQSNVNAP